MTILEAIKKRHSVRSYITKKIPEDIRQELTAAINACNKEGGLHMQLVTDDADAFHTLLAHYGKFRNVRNYIALIGPKTADLDEKIGYYGEKIVLQAQMLGLNTCWVALTFGKGAVRKKCEIKRGEKLVCVLALGYGETQGEFHKVKKISEICKNEMEMPKWYKTGLECALLAPTAMNQQKFAFARDGSTVSVRSTDGVYSKIDLGIVKYHFEIGAGMENFQWK